VRAKASSQPRSWNADAEGCSATSSSNDCPRVDYNLNIHGTCTLAQLKPVRERTRAHVLSRGIGNPLRGPPQATAIDAGPHATGISAITYQTSSCGRHSLGRVIAKLLKKNRLLEQDGTLSAAVQMSPQVEDSGTNLTTKCERLSQGLNWAQDHGSRASTLWTARTIDGANRSAAPNLSPSTSRTVLQACVSAAPTSISESPIIQDVSRSISCSRAACNN